jgi:hypothetical protein
MKYAFEMNSGGMILVQEQNFMTIGSVIQVILRFYRKYLRGCDVGTSIIDVRVL